MIPTLHQHRDQFAERNLFLHAVLGAISFGKRAMRRLEPLLDGPEGSAINKAPGERQGSPAAAWSSGPASPARRAEPGSMNSVYAVLGLIRLYKRCEEELDNWLREDPTPETAKLQDSLTRREHLEHTPKPRRLLR